MDFPPGPPLGKRVPACVAKAFSLRPRPAWSSILRGTGGFTDVGHGGLRFDKHRIHIGLIVCAENPRICFANPHRLRPPAGVLARGLKTLTRFLYARALHRVRFSAVSICNKKQVETLLYLPVTIGGAYEKNGELHQYRHPRGYPTRYLHCKGIEKLVCCRWNVPEIAISGVCKTPDGRLAVSPYNGIKRGTPCQGTPLEH